MNHSEIEKIYAECKEKSLVYPGFHQSDILPLLEDLKHFSCFKVVPLGESVQGRDIFAVCMGSGKTNVLLWSQMHGNEPTATMALFDIFNFFKKKALFRNAREELLRELSLYFVPMLNPDGAQYHRRENALGIDLNRDAARLVAPESQLLKKLRDEIKADFGFNLHDQSRIYKVGNSNMPASISFLSPQTGQNAPINKVREKSMKLIVALNKNLQNYIPGCVGKYSDAFLSIAFGDNMQKWGTSTVLIESGAVRGDVYKTLGRKLNFMAILGGLFSIARKTYEHENIQAYNEIPFNSKMLYDLVIRNVAIEKAGKSYTVDIGIFTQNEEFKDLSAPFKQSRIANIGDLSQYFGLQEFDAKGYTAEPAKIFAEVQENATDASAFDFWNLLSKGYSTIRIAQYPPHVENQDYCFDFCSAREESENAIAVGCKANMMLKKNKSVEFMLVNGRFYDMRKQQKVLM